jgi:hypothetical protein
MMTEGMTLDGADEESPENVASNERWMRGEHTKPES